MFIYTKLINKNKENIYFFPERCMCLFEILKFLSHLNENIMYIIRNNLNITSNNDNIKKTGKKLKKTSFTFF